MFRIPSRYSVGILTSLGLIIIFALMVNFNSTMDNMVFHTFIAMSNKSFCGEHLNETRVVRGVFKLSAAVQAEILKSYYWGYLASCPLGGIVSKQASAKWTWFTAILLNVIGCLLIPVTSEFHYAFLICVRVMQGFAGGLTFPATSILLAAWVPDIEKNTTCSIVFSGTILGTVIGRILANYLKDVWSWRSGFYVMGAVSSPWLIFWAVYVSDNPNTARYITQAEIDFIALSNEDTTDYAKRVHILWWNIYTSRPFWALFVSYVGTLTIFYVILLNLPLYLWSVLAFNIEDIIYMTTIAYISQWSFAIVIGYTLDMLRRHNKIDQTRARKISTFLSSGPSMVCLMAMGYTGCDRNVAMVLLMIAITCFGAMYCGCMANHIDIGPRMAGTLMAITNTMGVLGGIFLSLAIGKIVDDNPDVYSWQVVFWICMGIFITKMVCYGIWGTAKLQEDYYWVEPRGVISITKTSGSLLKNTSEVVPSTEKRK